MIKQQVKELSQVIHTDQFATDSLMIDLQERFDATVQHTVGSSIPSSGDPSHQTSGRQMNEMISSQSYTCSKEQEIVRKGIERLEKQILQYIDVYISRDQVNVTLIKKFKTTDVPAVISAIGNIQKALQKNVGFNGMDSEYCDRIGELMDSAQAWCLDIKEIYNKARFIQLTLLKVTLGMLEYFLTTPR